MHFEFGHIALILTVTFLVGLLATRLRQSTIPFFILSGIALQGVVDSHSEVISFMSVFGIILLLFMVGLEFSIANLVRARYKILVSGSIDLLCNFPLGVAMGALLGFGMLESLMLGGIVYISSSALISKSLIDLRRTAYAETEYVLGILVFEDLFIAVYLAVISGIASVGAPSWEGISLAILKALLFCGAMLLLALRGRRMLNRILGHESFELFILFIFAFLLVASSVAMALGLSEAIGAFMVGVVISETDFRERVEEVVLPFQQFYAAMFFVTFGLMINYDNFLGIALPGLALVALSMLTKVGTGLWTGRIFGLSKPASLRLGLTLIPRGEFSIIIAGLAAIETGRVLNIADLTAFYVLLLAVVGSMLMKDADRISRRIFPPKARPKQEVPSYAKPDG